jgi:hypothetical protein
MPSKPNAPKTYGIHYVKAATICHQVMVHAQAWLTMFYPYEIHTDPSPLALKTMLLTGAISMAVPMTAAAILRLNVAVSDSHQIQHASWRTYLPLCLGLMLLESCKQVWVYGAPGFFEWDALHTISLTILLILFIGRYSVMWLWPTAFAILGVTPLMLKWVDPLERLIIRNHPENGAFNENSLGIAYSLVFSVLWGFCFYRLLASSLSSKRKLQIGGAWILIGSLMVTFCQNIQGTWTSDFVLRTLPVGILVGARSGFHIWGFFPWAGVTILGFLIYDLMIRKPSWPWVWAIGVAGAFSILFFYWDYVDSTINKCTPNGKATGFNGLCFNRTPEQIFLIIGCFLFLVFEGRFVERWNLEFRLIRAVSRSILWIYLFTTTVMQNLAQWWVLHIPAKHLTWSFVVFCLICANLLAMLIDRLPSEISITLKKVEPAKGLS